MAVRVSDRDDWFDLWFQDKQDILTIMYQNMVDDLHAGYNPLGRSIKRQKLEIDQYTANLHAQMDTFHKMNEKEVNRWCFYDMKKRGAIE